MSKLILGQPAPEFELPDQNGDTVRLSQFRGRNPVVIFFYPKDDTTGCTIEACRFRDEFGKFSGIQDARIIGISSDSSASHAAFAAKYNLPYTLLSDRGGRVRKLYGVPKTFGILPGRATFVVDRGGVLRHFFSSQAQAAKHIDEALAALAAITP